MTLTPRQRLTVALGAFCAALAAAFFIAENWRMAVAPAPAAELAAAAASGQGASYRPTAESAPALSDAAAAGYQRGGAVAPDMRQFSSGNLLSTIPLPNIQTRDVDESGVPPQSDAALEYIIEFTERPLAVRYGELKGKAKAGLSPQSLAALAAQKALILKQQNTFLEALPLSMKAKNPELFRGMPPRFNTVLNGMRLTMSRAEAAALFSAANIRRFSIKRAELVKPVHALLKDSVPLIRAPEVWEGSPPPAPATTTAPSSTTPSFTITYPHEGMTFAPGGTLTVVWKSTNISSSTLVNISVGLRFHVRVANNGTHTIVVPADFATGIPPLTMNAVISGKNYVSPKVRISIASPPRPSLTVISPSQGETFPGNAGTSIDVRWVTENWPATEEYAFVNVDLIKQDNSPLRVGSYQPNNGLFRLNISKNQSASIIYRVRVSAARAGTLAPWEKSYSKNFTITPAVAPAPPPPPVLSISKGVTIAIIDTGVDYTHPDLGGCFGTRTEGNVAVPCKVAGGYDFVNRDPNPMDDNGHGTHVAAIAAGDGVLKGVAPGATIYAYKVLDNLGWDKSGRNIFDGLEAATDPNHDGDLSDHLDVANLSFGGLGDPDDAISRAVDNAVAAGVTIAVAAGNSGPEAQTIASPGAARDAITVGAADKFDNLASFSSRGPVKWTVSSFAGSEIGIKYLIKPDVVAPGVNICAARHAQAFPKGDVNCNNDNNHVAISGTSMATPYVAGAAALLLQAHPDWSPAEVKAALRNTATTLFQYPNRTDVGAGRIDTLRAVQSARPPVAQLAPIGTASHLIEIGGTAAAQSFSDYKLYLLGHSDPSIPFASSTKQVLNGVLSKLDPAAFNEGMSSVTLLVTDAFGTVSKDVGLFEVDNMKITSVGNFNYVNGGKKNIAGLHNLPGATSFQVVSDDPDKGPILCTGNVSPPPNGIIFCSADFSALPNGIHDLYLQVWQNGVKKTDAPFQIAVVKELIDNWPQEISDFFQNIGMQSVFGTDGNQSVRQLLVPHWPSLLFYSSNGSLTKISSLEDGTNPPFTYTPAIYYDNADKKNYFVLGGLKIIGSGGEILGTPNQNTDEEFGLATVFDRNGDGVPEVYAASLNRTSKEVKIVGYELRNGQPLQNFPILLSKGGASAKISYDRVSFLGGRGNASSTPAKNIALIAGDYRPGFQRSMDDLKLYAHIFSEKRQSVSDTLLFDGAGRRSYLAAVSTATADLDNDGDSEMIAEYSIVDVDLVLQNKENPEAYVTYIKILDGNGNISASAAIRGYTQNQLAVGDFGSGKPNIVAVLSDTWATTLKGNKIMLLDDSLTTIFAKDESALDSQNPLITGVAIGDINGDNKSEIVLGYSTRFADGSPSGVQILDSSGFLKRKIELPTLGAANSLVDASVVLDDFDGDGFADVVLQSVFLQKDFRDRILYPTRFYPLKLGGRFNSEKVSWKTFFHDNQRTGCYGCDSAFSTSTSTSTSTPTAPRMPPVIQSVTGPTNIIAGIATSTWTMTATDPDGVSFRYEVDWRDNSKTSGVKKYAATGTPQTIPFTRNFPTAGIFQPLFKVTDADGLIATSSPFAIAVTDARPTITVYPLRDAVWNRKGAHAVAYKLAEWRTLASASSSVSVFLDQFDGAEGLTRSVRLDPKPPIPISYRTVLSSFTVALPDSAKANLKNKIRLCAGDCGRDDPSGTSPGFFAIAEQPAQERNVGGETGENAASLRERLQKAAERINKLP